MQARIDQFGSLAWPICVLALIGVVLILRGLGHARYIARTATDAYVTVPMRVLNFRLAPLVVDGSEIATDQLTEKRSMVMVGYGYRVNGTAYVSDTVFPMEIEWFRPRVSPLRMLDDLESGRLRCCHVNLKHPSEALLFTGWSPHLRSHVLGVSASGALLIALSAVLCWLL
jgi:hypothetical protein